MEEYRSIIKEILGEIEPYEEIENDTDLIESQILDSLSIVFLVTQLEDKYNIVIDENKVLPQNFKSINIIAGILNELLNTRWRGFLWIK